MNSSKTSRPLPLPALLALVMLASHHARAQSFISNTQVGGLGGQHNATVTYNSGSMTNPGRAGLTVSAPGDVFKIERDAEGLLTRVSSTSTEMLITPSEEEWSKEDPKAFTMTLRNADGSVFRKTTIAFITVDGTPRFRLRSIYLGETVNDHGGRTEKGDVMLSEMHSPDKGVGVVTRGIEKDGKFISTSRNTKIRYRDEAAHKIIRLIDEVRSGPDDEWEATSDVLTETKKIDYNMEKIREVSFPDGEALTETWEYYTRGQVTGPDGSVADGPRLKLHKEADGTETLRQYLKHSSITEVRTPGGPVMRKTFSHDPATRDQTEIHERDGKETLRIVKRFEPTRVTTITRLAGEEEETYIEDYYPSGKRFGGKTSRIIRQDGTITTYEYTDLPEGALRTVTESGRGDGERVIEGTRTTTVRSGRGQLIETKSEPIGGRKDE